MTAAGAVQTFDIGRVISRLFGVLGRNLFSFVLLSVLLVGIPMGLLTYLQLGFMTPLLSASGDNAQSLIDRAFSPLNIGISVGAFLLSIICNAVLQGAVIHGAVSDLAGRRASFGEQLATGMRYLVPLVCIGLLAFIGLIVGFVLFIVPGVLLALAWCVAAPAEVIERRGVFGAFSRSLELTRNHRGAIFGLAVILYVVTFIIQSLIQGVVGTVVGLQAVTPTPGVRPDLRFFQSFFVIQSIVALIERTIISTITAAGVASIYYELRQVKEGVGAEQLASVFD